MESKIVGDSLGVQVVRTLAFHCQGPASISGQEMRSTSHGSGKSKTKVSSALIEARNRMETANRGMGKCDDQRVQKVQLCQIISSETCCIT